MIVNIWQDIDRVAFFENCILLEITRKSQGECLKFDKSNFQISNSSETPRRYHYSARDLLDDVCLVASGCGGADNVTAACLEHVDHEGTNLLLRLARNAGSNPQTLEAVRGILEEAAQGYKSGENEPEVRQRTRARIVARCRRRFQKHIANLARLLPQLGSFPIEASSNLPYIPTTDHNESPEDVRDLLIYGETTHSAYVTRQSERLRDIRKLVLKTAKSPRTVQEKDLECLIMQAYAVRKSSTFRRLLHCGVQQKNNDKSVIMTVRDVLERLGQLSKFERAASTIAKQVQKMLELNVTLQVEMLPSKPIQIHELSDRTSNQLRIRGGTSLNSLKTDHINSMMARWPAYREHAEMQLIMFYEENPNKRLHSQYIGCNKQSCFLCFNFIVRHGRFHVSGCHQSLYSLWAVRDRVDFENSEAAAKVQNSLMHLAEILQNKVESLKNPLWKPPRGGTGKESVANLSRTSLAFSTTVGNAPSLAGSSVMSTVSEVDLTQSLPRSKLCTTVDNIRVETSSYSNPLGSIISVTSSLPQWNQSQRFGYVESTYTSWRGRRVFLKSKRDKHTHRSHRRRECIAANPSQRAERRRNTRENLARPVLCDNLGTKSVYNRRLSKITRHQGPDKAAVLLRKVSCFLMKALFGVGYTKKRSS